MLETSIVCPPSSENTSMGNTITKMAKAEINAGVERGTKYLFGVSAGEAIEDSKEGRFQTDANWRGQSPRGGRGIQRLERASSQLPPRKASASDCKGVE